MSEKNYMDDDFEVPDGCELIEDAGNLLLLDLDTLEDEQQFDDLRNIFYFFIGAVDEQEWGSRNGGKHVVIELDGDLPLEHRLLLQVCLGSDPKRSLLTFCKNFRGRKGSNVLFRPSLRGNQETAE
jgi:hypothetical protein